MTASARCKPYLYIRACTVHWNCSQETQSNFIPRYLEVVLLIRTFEPEKCKRANLTAIAMSILKILSYGYNLATIKSQRNINSYDIRSQKVWFTTLSLRKQGCKSTSYVIYTLFYIQKLHSLRVLSTFPVLYPFICRVCCTKCQSHE